MASQQQFKECGQVMKPHSKPDNHDSQEEIRKTVKDTMDEMLNVVSTKTDMFFNNPYYSLKIKMLAGLMKVREGIEEYNAARKRYIQNYGPHSAQVGDLPSFDFKVITKDAATTSRPTDTRPEPRTDLELDTDTRPESDSSDCECLGVFPPKPPLEITLD